MSDSLRSVFRLLVTDNADLISLILFNLMKQAIRSFETSVVTRATRRHASEDSILHSQRSEELKSYIEETNFTEAKLVITTT
jgi:hypothetical protein